MKTLPLHVFPRALTRRSGVRRLRASGRVPAVIYGRQRQPQNLEIRRKEIEDLIHHSVTENLLFDLSVEQESGAKRLVLLQEVQHHPLTGEILHIDFHEVSETEKITVQVPVETIGEAAGVKTGGGILEHVLFKVKVRCLPKDLPEAIIVDVAHLEIGQSVHIGELKPPPGVEVLGDKHISVISIAAPITEEQEQAALDASAATTVGDVEMIKEKKEEGEAAPAEKGKPAAAGAKAGEKAPAAEKAPTAEKAAADKGAAKPAEKKK
jgi:large subunit ribosomal protein L25